MPLRLAHSVFPRKLPRFSGVLLSLLLITPSVGPVASAQVVTEVIDSIIEAGIDDRVYPAAVVLIGRADTVLYSQGYGNYSWRGDSRRPDPEWSLWDIASLSKVVATASAVAVLVDGGRLDLDTPVGQFLPDFRGVAKDKVTVRMLLDHTSGLPAWVPLRSDPQSIAGSLGTLYDTDLRRDPGEVAVYSDLNAILAALVVEQVSGDSLARFTEASVFGPTGMNGTFWRPTAADRLRAVPSERQGDGTPRMGRVHDPNARLLGGVAGHAGVFATGVDLARFTQQWMNGITGADSSWISSATLRQFLERSDASGTRALGWDTPRLEVEDGGPSLYGYCTTENTYGHTGFTGTMIWFDVEQDLFVVLLTNRSYQPVRGSFDAIREVRALVSDQARRMVGVPCTNRSVSDRGTP